MKKAIVFILLLLVGIAVFVLVLFHTGIENIISALAKITLLQILVYLLISTGNFCLYTWRWSLILSSHGHRVGFWKLFFYRMVGYSVSYLTPVAQVGGEPFRIYFLNDRDKISIKESTSSVVIDKVFELATLLVFIGSGALYVLVKGILSPKMEFVLVAFLILSVYMLYVFFKKTLDGTGFFSFLFRFFRFSKIKRIAHWEEKIIHTEHFISKFFQESPKNTVPLCILVSLLTVAVIMFEHWILTVFLGLSFSFSGVFLIATLPSLAYILPVPGGFGLLEGGHSSIFAFLGYHPALAVALVFLIRIRDLFFVLLGLLYAMHQGITMLLTSGGAQELKEMMKEKGGTHNL